MKHGRKRGPPLNHVQKYRQIQIYAKKFKVDVPNPVDRTSKAIVSRYHRILFGGYKKNGKFTYGITKSYKTTTKPIAKRLPFAPLRAPRIHAYIFPKLFGKLINISRKDIATFKTPIGKMKLLLMNKQKWALALKNQDEQLLRQLLKPVADEQIQIAIHGQNLGFKISPLDNMVNFILTNAAKTTSWADPQAIDVVIL